MNYIPFELPGFRLTAVEAEAQATAAKCLQCHRLSSHVHTHYLRRPCDLACSGKAIRLAPRVRRFRCRNPKCASKIFCERLPNVVGISTQRTQRLTATLLLVHIDSGAVALEIQRYRKHVDLAPLIYEVVRNYNLSASALYSTCLRRQTPRYFRLVEANTLSRVSLHIL